MQSIYGSFEQLMMTGAIGYARIAPVFYLLPFLNDRVVVGTVLKNTIIFAVIIGLWPAFPTWPAGSGFSAWLWMAVNEAAVGFMLGVMLALPFWAASAIGELIDNERGATMADSIDPASGVEASVTAPFVTMFYAVGFLQNDGMHKVVQVLHNSYRYVDVGKLIDVQIELSRIGMMLTDVMCKGLELAAPVLIIMFLSDALLGLFSRFCPQLNAFSLSTSIKSLIAFSVFLLYFALAVPPSLNELMSWHPLESLLK